MPAQLGERPVKRPRFTGRLVKQDFDPHPLQQWRRLFYDGCHGDNHGLEKLGMYRPGGYHPIHIGDELHHRRFRVIHKLGYGGSSTVWLCRDQSGIEPKYVAVKIFVASLKEPECRELIAYKLKDEGMGNQGMHMCFPNGQFTSKSSNGTHLCLVYPVLGPTVDHAASIFEEQNVNDTVRKISRSVVVALDILHRRGICHADFRPANVVLGLMSLDGLDEEEVLAQLGKPNTISVKIREDSRPTPEIPYAPRHIVEPVHFHGRRCSRLVLPRVVIIDFGQAVEIAAENAPYGIPVNYAAPELIQDHSGGQEVDLWSLACTLYELRVGRRLFDVPVLAAFSEEDYMDEICSVLGDPGNGESDQATAGEICKRAFDVDVTSEQRQWAEMLASLLKYEPKRRLQAQDLLKKIHGLMDSLQNSIRYVRGLDVREWNMKFRLKRLSPCNSD